MTYHAMDGLHCRLAGAGLDDAAIEELSADAYRYARLSPGPEVHAVRLRVLDKVYNSGSSVGDSVWAICKNGALLTVYLRRVQQGPPECDKATILAGRDPQ
jgi:hypothetical protein